MDLIKLNLERAVSLYTMFSVMDVICKCESETDDRC